MISASMQVTERGEAMSGQVVGKVAFDRMWLVMVYFVVTVITAIQAILSSSFAVGAIALVACGLCFFGAAVFAGSFRARHVKKSTAKELLGIAAIALVLIAAGFALMIWSGFWLNLLGVAIQGRYWALAGA